jgi:hypothetical protein
VPDDAAARAVRDAEHVVQDAEGVMVELMAQDLARDLRESGPNPPPRLLPACCGAPPI